MTLATPATATAAGSVTANQSGVNVYADGLSVDLREGRFLYLGRTAVQPQNLQFGTQAAPSGVSALPSAAADGINVLHFGNAPINSVLEMHQTTAQTLMPLRHASKGIEIALDQVDNETVEYVPGGNHAANPLGCLVGTDPGIVLKATFEITTNNGMDQFGIFFRKQENYVTPTSFLAGGDGIYVDFVGMGFNAAVASPNPIGVVSDTNNGGVTARSAANFTVTSGMIITLEMRLRGRKVRYFINGVELGGRVAKDGVGTAITAQQTTSVASYSFTSGLFVIPMIFCRQDAGTSTVFLRELLCAHLRSVGMANEDR